MGDSEDVRLDNRGDNRVGQALVGRRQESRGLRGFRGRTPYVEGGAKVPRSWPGRVAMLVLLAAALAFAVAVAV